MPAIKATDPHLSAEVILNHYFRSGRAHVLPMADEYAFAEFIGFVCTQGARFINGKLAKMSVAAITNGDGGEGSTWRTVEKGDAVYAMVVIGHGNPREECYILVNDEGWPILAGITPPEYFPPDAEYVPERHETFGHLMPKKWGA